MPDATYRLGQGGGQRVRTFAIALKQMKSNSLGRLLTNTRHAAQPVDKANK
jgi:hypothetical protein